MGAVWGEVGGAFHFILIGSWNSWIRGRQKAIWQSPCSQPGLNEEGRVEMRGLWRASNEERSQKTPAQPQQSSGHRKVGHVVGGWLGCMLYWRRREEREVRGGMER